jgi:hypothetical protein
MASIGERLREIDQHAHQSDEIPANRPENKEKAEGSRETIVGSASDRGRSKARRSEPEEERRSDR